MLGSASVSDTKRALETSSPYKRCSVYMTSESRTLEGGVLERGARKYGELARGSGLSKGKSKLRLSTAGFAAALPRLRTVWALPTHISPRNTVQRHSKSLRNYCVKDKEVSVKRDHMLFQVKSRLTSVSGTVTAKIVIECFRFPFFPFLF